MDASRVLPRVNPPALTPVHKSLLVEVHKMPKKSSSKPPKPQEDLVAAPDKNPSPAPKKPSKEIDEIFAARKRKKPEKNQDNPVKDKGTSKLDKMNKKRSKKRIAPKENAGTVDPPAQPRKRTGDGFTVYSEEELGIGKADAGGTRLCPFDCSCCF